MITKARIELDNYDVSSLIIALQWLKEEKETDKYIEWTEAEDNLLRKLLDYEKVLHAVPTDEWVVKDGCVMLVESETRKE